MAKNGVGFDIFSFASLHAPSRFQSGPVGMDNALCGAVAGLAVDVVLFPLDTIKTRLMSTSRVTSNWRNVYNGLLPAAACSMPSAALFFVGYEKGKEVSGNAVVGGCFGEMSACIVRVPCDAVKQRMQVGYQGSVRAAVSAILSSSGVFGFYRGYGATLAREFPFAGIQMSTFEALKKRFGSEVWKCGVYGAISGGVAAALTTPIDVAKTRLMLAESNRNLWQTLIHIARTEGPMSLFSGIGPRTAMISMGGFVFLGTFALVKDIMLRRKLLV